LQGRQGAACHALKGHIRARQVRQGVSPLSAPWWSKEVASGAPWILGGPWHQRGAPNTHSSDKTDTKDPNKRIDTERKLQTFKCLCIIIVYVRVWAIGMQSIVPAPVAFPARCCILGGDQTINRLKKDSQLANTYAERN